MNAIYFDMDGTIANLYEHDNWSKRLDDEDETLYLNARPLLNLSLLARYLNKLSKMTNIYIISWLSKTGSEDFKNRIATAKLKWLKNHLPSVQWDKIIIVDYGTKKSQFLKEKGDILFDDDERNIVDWSNVGGRALYPAQIIDELKKMAV